MEDLFGVFFASRTHDIYMRVLLDSYSIHPPQSYIVVHEQVRAVVRIQKSRREDLKRSS